MYFDDTIYRRPLPVNVYQFALSSAADRDGTYTERADSLALKERERRSSFT